MCFPVEHGNLKKKITSCLERNLLNILDLTFLPYLAAVDQKGSASCHQKGACVLLASSRSKNLRDLRSNMMSPLILWSSGYFPVMWSSWISGWINFALVIGARYLLPSTSKPGSPPVGRRGEPWACGFRDGEGI